MKFVRQGPFDNNPAFVQMMAWCKTFDKPSSGAVMAEFIDAYKRHSLRVKNMGCSYIWRNTHFLHIDAKI